MKKASKLTALTAGLFIGAGAGLGGCTAANESEAQNSDPLATDVRYTANGNTLTMTATHKSCSADDYIISQAAIMHIRLDTAAKDLMETATLNEITAAYEKTMMPHIQAVYNLMVSDMSSAEYNFMTKGPAAGMTEEDISELMDRAMDKAAIALDYMTENMNALFNDKMRFNEAVKNTFAPHVMTIKDVKGVQQPAISKAPSPACK